MTLLQAGVPKSGNFWLYRMIRLASAEAGRDHKSFITAQAIYEQARDWRLSFEGQAEVDALDLDRQGCSYRISGRFKAPIVDIDSYIAACSHVWTHSPMTMTGLDVVPKFDSVVYIIRDPRDVAWSMARYAFTPHKLANHPPHFESDPQSWLRHRLDGMMRDWVLHVTGWLAQHEALRIHVVFYERLLADFDGEFDRLLRYLEIDLPASSREAVKTAVQFKTMQSTNPDHLRSGKASGWRDVMTPDQVHETARIAGRLLELLGYSFDGNAVTGSELPMMPARLDQARLETARHQARRSVADEVRRIAGFALSDRSLRHKLNRLREALT